MVDISISTEAKQDPNNITLENYPTTGHTKKFTIDKEMESFFILIFFYSSKQYNTMSYLSCRKFWPT